MSYYGYLAKYFPDNMSPSDVAKEIWDFEMKFFDEHPEMLWLEGYPNEVARIQDEAIEKAFIEQRKH